MVDASTPVALTVPETRKFLSYTCPASLDDGQLLIQRRAKKDKYPYGYPGDELGAKTIARYGCHECKAPFPQGAAAGADCSQCSHKRCDSCQRLKPRKVEPEPDPEVWKAVQAKLGELTLK